MSENSRAHQHVLLVWTGIILASVGPASGAVICVHPGAAGANDGTSWADAFPDLQFRIDDQLAEGDKVMTRWTVSGTHKGQLGPVPPTNVLVDVTGTNIHRFADGKIVESWENWDRFGLMQQLGVIPSE